MLLRGKDGKQSDFSANARLQLDQIKAKWGLHKRGCVKRWQKSSWAFSYQEASHWDKHKPYPVVQNTPDPQRRWWSTWATAADIPGGHRRCRSKAPAVTASYTFNFAVVWL